MKRWIYNLVCPLALAMMLGSDDGPSSGGPSCPPGGTRQSGFHDGHFRVLIVGTHRGIGTAEVDDSEISVSATLTTPQGGSIRLEAGELRAIGPYFAGYGTLGSARVYISGRLDLVKASRVVATFISEDGKAGRIVGLLPNDPGNPNWTGHDSHGDDDDDDDDDSHRDD